jgi:lipid-binding SYLF domain-containing protein
MRIQNLALLAKHSAAVLSAAALLFGLSHAVAAEKASDSAAALTSDARSALNTLYGKTSGAKAIGKQAVAILVFPRVTKAGFVVGGQYGKGTLLRGDKAAAFYETAGLSYGLQAGAQAYGYAMFFMNENALAELDKADGFEIGVGPTVVVIDEGKARNITTTTVKDDIYAFVFSQKGLMAGIGLQGNKITRVDPK